MTIKSWLRRLRFPRPVSPAKRPRQPSGQSGRHANLLLEPLESRVAPAAISWTGDANTLNWGDANNWSTNSVPGSGDDVTISKSGVGTITVAGTFAVDSLNDTTAVLSIASGASLSLAAVAVTSTFGQNVTVQSGGTLTVGAGATVQIAITSPTTSVTLTDNGVLSFGTNDTVNLNSSSEYGTTAQIVASGGGELKASGATFAAGGTGVSQVVINSDAVVNPGDLVGNAFNVTLVVAAIDVQYLSGSGNNNLQFKDIDIQPGTLTSGQSVALNAIGTATTAHLRYLFLSNFTVGSGATLSVGANVNVQIANPNSTPETSVTLTDNGVLSFGANDTATLNSSSEYGTTAEILASGGGDLQANGTTFAAAGNGVSQVVVNSDAVLNAGDLVGNAFNLPLVIPAIDVQYLYGSANNNLQFKDIDIQAGTLTSGQSVALNAIGTATTANLHYLFLSNFTVGSGATLNVGANVNVQIANPNSTPETSVTLTDNGVLSFGANDTVTLNSSSEYGTTAEILASGGGDLKANGTTFAAAGNGVSQVVVNSDAVLNAGDLVGNAFNLPLVIPAIDVQYLYGSANNNLQFKDIDIQAGTLTSGQSVALNAIGTATTANLRYVFLSNFTVGTGATLNVGANVNVQIANPNSTPETSVTLTDNGVLSFGSNDTVTLNSSSEYGTTAEILASGGGDLKASGTTFAAAGNGVSQVVVNSDAVLNAGDLVGNAFNLPLFIPAIDVQYLYGSANNNLQFKDIDIQAGTLTSGQSVALNAIGTATTANLRYVFLSNFTVGTGATLNVGANVNVEIANPNSTPETSVTLTDNGVLSFGSNDTVTLNSSSEYGTTAEILASGGGDLKASGTTFAAAGNGVSQVVINSDAVENAGDLVGNAFNLPLFIPAIDVQYLYGSANNNLSFKDIDIQAGTLTSGQSVALNAIGTATTANLRYVFLSNFTVGTGATLNVGANVNVEIANPNSTPETSVTLTDNGVLSFGANDTVTLNSSSEYGTTAEILASGGGDLKANGTTFAAAGSGVGQVVINAGAVVNAGDLVGNTFSLPLFIPAIDVQYLSGSANNNLSFKDIDIQAGTLTSGQTVALNAIGTATTANLHYVFPSNVTVSTGATLTVAPSLPVLIAAGVTLTDNGTLTTASGDAITFAYSSGTTTQIAVGSGGVLNAGGTAFTAASTSNTTQVNINAGGQFTAIGDTFSVTTVTLSSGSNDTLQLNTFSSQLAINSGATFAIHYNDLTNVPGSNNGIIASGTSTATIDLTNNYWGTTNTALIAAKIKDHTTNSSLPTVLYTPYLSLEPALTTASAASAAYSTAAQTVTLTATVASPAGVVSQGTESFTVLTGSTTIGNPVTANVSSGVATAAYTLPAATAPGTYTIQAVYNGTSTYTSSTDSSHSLTIGTGGTTTAAANASTTYAVGSQSVSLSATVSSSSGTVNEGTETFTILSGSTTIGSPVTGNVASGAASASYTLPAGTAVATYTIEAVYNGTANFVGSTDTSHSLTIGAATTATTAANAATIYTAASQSVSLSATVTSSAGTVNVGTETFTILNGSTPVGTSVTVNVSSGAASASYTLPAATALGTYTIQAVYNGTSNFGGSTDTGHTLIVGPAAISWTGNAGTLNWGDAANWSNNAVPTSMNDVTISKSGVGTINIGAASYAVHSLNDTTASLSIASGGTLSLAAVAAPSTFGQNVTIQSGGTLAVGAGASVVIGPPPQQTTQTLADNGTLTFAAGDTVTLNSITYESVSLILVGSGGILNASGTTFNDTSAGDSQIVIASGGHLQASNSTFNIYQQGQLNLNIGAVLNAGDLTGNSFNCPLVIPAIDVQYLSGSANNNLQFQNIFIQPGTLTSGQSVALNAIGTQSTTNLQYVFPGNFTINQGATLSVGPNVPVLIGPAPYEGTQTLTDNGTLTFGASDTVTLNATAYESEALILVGSGGLLIASGATFNTSTSSNSQIVVASGGHLQASNSTFNINQVNLNIGAVLNAGDLVGNAFNVPLYIPAIDVHYLSGTGNNNLQFQAIDIQPDTLTNGQSVALTLIGTQNTSNLSYVFPGNFTINQGATLSVGANVPVLIGPAPYEGTQTIADNGTLTFAASDVVTLNSIAYESEALILVGSGGLLTASGATFNTSTSGNSQIVVASGGHLQASNSTFNINQVNLNIGAVLNAGDLVGNAFNVPLYIPAIDVQYLSGTGNNNLQFQAIDIQPDTLTNGQSVALTVIGTQNTSNLSYVFPGNFTINQGATLSVGANVPVLIGPAPYEGTQTIADNGTLTFAAGDVVTLNSIAYESEALILVGSGGLLTASGATFNTSTSGNSQIVVASGGHLQASNSTFNINQVNLNIGAVLNAGDLVGNAFNVPLYIPAIDVQYLSGTGNNNLQFQAIDIQPDTLTNGQSVALTVIGTHNTSNLSYVFPGNFTINQGATLSVGANVPVLIGPAPYEGTQTIADNGTLTFAAGDVVTLNSIAYESEALILVGSGGLMNASGTTFNATTSSYNTQIVVNSGGQLTANGDAFSLTSVTLNSGSAGTIQLDAFSSQLAINSGAAFTINANDLANVPGSNNGIIASGTSTATINLTNNYWGTTVAAQIAAKIKDHTTNSSLPTVSYTPYLSLEPALTTAAAASAIYNAAAQNVTLSATVASTTGVVSQGTETFTVLSGSTTIGNPVTVNVSSGAASANYVLPAATAPGTYTIQAVYNGTSTYTGSTDTSHSLTVGTGGTTTAAANATTTYTVGSQSVSLSATVSSSGGTVNEGTETFTIQSGSTTIGSPVTVNVASGAASANYTLPAGTAVATYTIVAVYNGTANFVGATDSSHTLTVGAASTATAAVNASTTYSGSSQSVSLSATVTSSAGTVNVGTETFTVLNGSTPVGNSVTASVSSGAVSASYTLPAATAIGTYTIQAVYNGTANFGGSTDTGHSLTVGSIAISWTGNAGTLNWSDAANWSTGAVPTSLNDVTISKSGVGTITVGAGTYAVRSLNDTTAVLSIASGATLSLAAVSATSTFGQNVTVQSGGTLNVGAGASVTISNYQTLTDSGTVTFAAGDTVTILYDNTTQIVVTNGGLLSATGTTFIDPPNNGYGQIIVNAGGHLTASNCNFSTIDNVYLNNGSVLNATDLTGDTFGCALYLPEADVADLSSTGNTQNVQFQNIYILSGSVPTGQTLALNAIGTSTANLLYSFPGAFTVQSGATMSVAANLPIKIWNYQTLTDSGTVTFAAGDTVTILYDNTTQIVVTNGGLLSATGTTFIDPPNNGYGQIIVNAGGHLTASNCNFSTINEVYLNNGSILNATDLTGDTFGCPLYLPESDVADLSSTGNTQNVQFQSIYILSGTVPTGQTLALNAIGTSTANLLYNFPGAFTVQSGATMSVAANVPIKIWNYQTLTDSGTVTFAAGDTVTILYDNTTQIVVTNGGLLSATGTTFIDPPNNGYGQIIVNAGGHLTASNCNFSTINEVYLNNGSILNATDLTGDTFGCPLYLPESDVADLSSSGNTQNVQFQSIYILSGSVPTGQTLALNAIGTSTANLLYNFPGNFTVQSGATMSVAANVPIKIWNYQTLTDSGTVTFAAGDTVTILYDNTTQIVVTNGGLLSATGTTFIDPPNNGYGQIIVNAGGHLTASNCNFSTINEVYLNNGSILNATDLTGDTFGCPLYLPESDVADLSSTGNTQNVQFQNIYILSGSVPTGQTLALNAIGSSTANLHYIFSGAFTVQSGATMSVAANVPITISNYQTLTDSGTVTFATGDTVTILYDNTTQIVVTNGGLLERQRHHLQRPS